MSLTRQLPIQDKAAADVIYCVGKKAFSQSLSVAGKATVHHEK